MLKAFGIALAIELLLVIAHGTISPSRRVLPLGGSDLSQLGVLLGLAAVYTELAMLIR